MYGYCWEKFYVNHFWKLKGSSNKKKKNIEKGSEVASYTLPY